MTTRRARASDACFVLGGVALLSAAFLHWVRRGPGAALRGHELIDAAARVANRVDGGGWQVTALTIVWYLIPASGALAWVVVGFGDPKGRSGKAVAGIATLATSISVAGLGTQLQWSRLGPGTVAASLGATLLIFGAAIPHPRSHTSRANRQIQ